MARWGFSPSFVVFGTRCAVSFVWSVFSSGKGRKAEQATLFFFEGTLSIKS